VGNQTPLVISLVPLMTIQGVLVAICPAPIAI